MPSWLLAFVAVGSMTGAGDPPTQATTQYYFPPGSRWVATEGRRGDCKHVEGGVTFLAGNKVQVYWQARTNGGWVGCTKTYKYQVDPASTLPTIQNHYGFLEWEQGQFRMVGNRLELNLAESSSFFPNILELQGKLSLVLQCEK